MDRGEEIIGLNGAAAVLDVPPETVRRFAQEGRLRSEGGEEGEYVFHLEDVLGLARELGAESAEEGQEQKPPPRGADPSDRRDSPGTRRGEDGDRPPLVRDRTPQPRRVPARTAGEDDLDPRRGESYATVRARAAPQGTDGPRGGEIGPL